MLAGEHPPALWLVVFWHSSWNWSWGESLAASGIDLQPSLRSFCGDQHLTLAGIVCYWGKRAGRAWGVTSNSVLAFTVRCGAHQYGLCLLAGTQHQY